MTGLQEDLRHPSIYALVPLVSSHRYQGPGRMDYKSDLLADAMGGLTGLLTHNLICFSCYIIEERTCLKDKEWGQTGVKRIAGTLGCTMDPPAATE